MLNILKWIFPGIAIISVMGICGCSAVFDHHGYVVEDDGFSQHSHYEGARWSSKDFEAVEGKIHVTAKPFESRVLWGGPIIPFIPVSLWVSPDTTYTAASNYVALQFNISAKVPVSVDWNKVVVTTADGKILATRPADSFFHILALYKNEKDRYTVHCSLEGVAEPHPVIAVDLPLIHVGGKFLKLAPFTLEVQEGRHFDIGFK